MSNNGGTDIKNMNSISFHTGLSTQGRVSSHISIKLMLTMWCDFHNNCRTYGSTTDGSN